MCLSSNVEEFWQQHQQQLSKARYTLATKSIIAETGDKSAAKSTVAVDVQLCCRYGLYGAKAARSTALNSTLSPVCTGLKTVDVDKKLEVHQVKAFSQFVGLHCQRNVDA